VNKRVSLRGTERVGEGERERQGERGGERKREREGGGERERQIKRRACLGRGQTIVLVTVGL
jgi:hypothetical protein